MKNVTVIGTCRVYEPYKILVEQGSLEIKNAGVFGYTHTTKEALQVVKNAKSKLVVEDVLIPFVGKNGLQHYKGKGVCDSDVVILEISSLRLFRIGDVYFRSNLVRDYLKDRLSGFDTWWKDLSRGELKDNLDPKYGFDIDSLDETSQYLVRNIECVHQSKSDFIKDMNEIMSFFNEDQKVILISHFDIKIKGSDVRVPERVKMVSWLREFAENKNISFINPRFELEKFGEDKGLAGVAHYSKEFEHHMAKVFLKAVGGVSVRSYIEGIKTYLRRIIRK